VPLSQPDGISSSEEAATWAQRALGAKNRLTATDAESVEQSFEARLATLTSQDTEAAELPQAKEPVQGPEPLGRRPAKQRRRSTAAAINSTIDKSVLALPEPRRIRDRDHVRYVAKQPCLICGRRPADAHHLRFAQHRALGRKVSDEFIVPLCRGHHREVHRSGDEASWWRKAGIDPTGAARTLWTETHPLRPVAGAPNADQSTPSRAARSESTSVPRLPKGTRNRKTKPIIAAGVAALKRARGNHANLQQCAVKGVVGCMAVRRDRALRAAIKTRSSTECIRAKPLRNAGRCGTCCVNRACYWNG
jgi:hypothetical protein